MWAQARMETQSPRQMRNAIGTSNLQIASTFGHRPVTERITYFCQTAKTTDLITPDKFSQLDHYLVEKQWATKVTNCKSHVLAALSSHHFLMTANVEVVAQKAVPSHGHCVRRDWGHLREMAHANQFRQQIVAHISTPPNRILLPNL